MIKIVLNENLNLLSVDEIDRVDEFKIDSELMFVSKNLTVIYSSDSNTYKVYCHRGCEMDYIESIIRNYLLPIKEDKNYNWFDSKMSNKLTITKLVLGYNSNAIIKDNTIITKHNNILVLYTITNEQIESSSISWNLL
jgi:hypothetical protein